MGDIFWGSYNFKHFLGCPKFLIFFGVNGSCWATYTEKYRAGIPRVIIEIKIKITIILT